MKVPRPKLWLLGLYLFSSLYLAGLIYSVYGQGQRELLTEGQFSLSTYTSPIDVLVIDEIATEQERQAARAQISQVFTIDTKIMELVKEAILASDLPSDSFDVVFKAYTNSAGIRTGDIPALIEKAVLSGSAEKRHNIRLALNRILLATSTANLELTQAARKAAAAAVTPTMRSLGAGQVIVRAGEQLTDENLRVLEVVGLYSAQSDALNQTLLIVISSIILGTLVSGGIPYAVQRIPSLTRAQFAFLVFLSIAILTIQRFAVLAIDDLVVIALVPVLVAVLVSETVALFWAGWLALIASFLVPSGSLETLLSALVSAVTAVLLVRLVRSRLALLIAPTLGGALGGLAYFSITTLGDTSTLLSAGLGAFLVLIGGLVAGIGALGMLPIAESVFGFLTNFRLLELANPNNALLRRLLLEAPGTYQHSVIISHLAEPAVQQLGGNQLIARAGALYHDVGKLKRPRFFIENQFSTENPHDKISPHLSYLIITNHVREGLNLLRAYRLPRVLDQFVSEHHGTTVLNYFYKRALEETQTVEELNFSYPGPKPSSVESAVLMLADSIEPSSRTLKDPNPSNIRSLIDRIINERLQGDQLTDSPLTLRDLEIVASSFERTLTAILHKRIAYPSAEEIRSLRRGRDYRRDTTIPNQ
jgi:putative nucleotidyltransferase with HDIG domain